MAVMAAWCKTGVQVIESAVAAVRGRYSHNMAAGRDAAE
jgi:hypothetical protein